MPSWIRSWAALCICRRPLRRAIIPGICLNRRSARLGYLTIRNFTSGAPRRRRRSKAAHLAGLAFQAPQGSSFSRQRWEKIGGSGGKDRGKAQIIDGQDRWKLYGEDASAEPHPSTSADGHDCLPTPIGLSRPCGFAPVCCQDARQEVGTSQIARNRSREQGAKPFTCQRTIVVDPGNRWQLRQIGWCPRQYSRKRHSAGKLCEESLVHPAVPSAVDRGGWHIVFNQLRVFELVGALFLQRLPRDFRIHDKGGAFIGGMEHKRIW